VLALRRQAVQAAPNDPEIRLQLAKLLEARREIADALREYETVRGLAPDDSDVQQAVAAAFLRNGLLREATMAAEHAVRLSPEDDDLRVELGDLYVRMGMSDQAREQYRRVLARQPAHEAASRGLRAIGALQNPG
jgi:Flp pilus assembly protein TadD